MTQLTQGQPAGGHDPIDPKPAGGLADQVQQLGRRALGHAKNKKAPGQKAPGLERQQIAGSRALAAGRGRPARLELRAGGRSAVGSALAGPGRAERPAAPGPEGLQKL